MKKTVRLSKIEQAKVMCWHCNGWVEHDKIHLCPAAKPLSIVWPWEGFEITYYNGRPI